MFSSKYWTIWEQLVKIWHMEEPKHGKQARVKKVNRKRNLDEKRGKMKMLSIQIKEDRIQLQKGKYYEFR